MLGTLTRVQLSKRKVEKAITTTFLRASTQKKLFVEKNPNYKGHKKGNYEPHTRYYAKTDTIQHN